MKKFGFAGLPGKKDRPAAEQGGAPKAPRRRRRWIIVGAAALAAALGCAFLLPRLHPAAAASSEDLSLARTVKLEKGRLDNTVSVSGTVQSATVSTVTTTLAAKVTAVHVKVGDHVSKGDVICTLDTTDIDKQIADKKAALADAAGQLKDDYQKLQNQLDRAKTEKANVQKTQDALVAAAQSARDAAKNDLASLQSGYNATKSQYDTMMKVVQPYIDVLNAASAKRQTAYDAWIAAGGAAATADPSGSAAPTAYDAYQSALQAEQAAQAALDSAKTLYSFGTYNDAMAAAQSGYDAKKAALDTAQAALDAATNARQTALNEQDNTISDLAAQTTASYNKMQKGTSDRDLSDLQKKKDDAVLKAESDGEVTELNVTVGSIPKDAVAKIQSTTDLVLRVSIPEADINRVSPGLAARITADSIQTPASGTLTTVSATADSSDAGTSGTSGTGGYAATITITDAQGLHIGSKAKAELILSTKDDVYTVPIDAVGTAADGSSYLRRMKTDGTTEDIPVTTGDQNDYSIEVSGSALTDGLEVLADANWSALADSAAAAASANTSYGGI